MLFTPWEPGARVVRGGIQLLQPQPQPPDCWVIKRSCDPRPEGLLGCRPISLDGFMIQVCLIIV